MAFSVGIIILNWNGWEYTRNCLNNLKEAGFPSSQIILVDNHSLDGSFEKIKDHFQGINLIQNATNLGFAGGNNVGMAAAIKMGFEYIMLLNNDTEPGPGFWKPLVSEMEENPNLGAIQPLIYFLKEKNKIWNAGGKYYPMLVHSQTQYQIEHSQLPYATDWITGCAILVRTKVIQKIGMLDEQYFAYFEDVDWSLRMRKAGFELKVHPSSIIYHEAGASSKSQIKENEGFLSPKVHYLNVRNQVFQLRKHGASPLSIIAWPFHFVKFGLYCVYFLLRGRQGKWRAVVRGMNDGWNTPLISVQ